MKIKVKAEKIKKFDKINLLFKEKTVDYILCSKKEKYIKIYFMDKTFISCLSNENIIVDRNNFYALTHKIFTNNFLDLL